jgi:hypothetical protein
MDREAEHSDHRDPEAGTRKLVQERLAHRLSPPIAGSLLLRAPVAPRLSDLEL